MVCKPAVTTGIMVAMTTWETGHEVTRLKFFEANATPTTQSTLHDQLRGLLKDENLGIRGRLDASGRSCSARLWPLRRLYRPQRLTEQDKIRHDKTALCCQQDGKCS